jgi:hypothetical protein
VARIREDAMTQYDDRRELILDRLAALLEGLTIPLLGGPPPATVTEIPAGNFDRNRNELDKTKVPGILLLDGDEVRDTRQTLQPRGQQESQVPTQVMKMTPEIYVVLDVRGISNQNVGQDLNTARRMILATVLPDQTLQSIVGGNGDIVYDGCVTDLAKNRAMKGQLGISITFTYPLIRNEYVGIP